MKCTAIVVAGGSGDRFGGLKQFAMLGTKSIAAHSVETCRVIADKVILVVPNGMTGESHGADHVIEGGATRSASVRAGLSLVQDDVEVVVVHDAARPLATPRLFFAVVAELSDERVDAAICAVPVNDTIKEVTQIEGRRRVVHTLHRDDLVAVQTPQAFRADILRRAHLGEGDAHDDAALVEQNGGLIVVVAGEEENMKITSPSDLLVAEELLGARS